MTENTPTRKLEYLDRLPRGWFVLDVMKATSRKWDWVALVIDVPPEEYRPGEGARPCLVRIPGKHRTHEGAWDALENMIATRH